jgi:maltooligosyltrehalose trehalohydrolase
VETFRCAVLDQSRIDDEAHRRMLDYYRTLLRLRRELPRPRRMDSNEYGVEHDDGAGTVVLRWCGHDGERALRRSG